MKRTFRWGSCFAIEQLPKACCPFI
jgi:hypothetical protein